MALKTLYEAKGHTIEELLEQFNISRGTLYKVVQGEY
ncbi:helix-turn-helix domain-containing protein [Rapidithrix thailandica]